MINKKDNSQSDSEDSSIIRDLNVEEVKEDIFIPKSGYEQESTILDKINKTDFSRSETLSITQRLRE